MSKIKFHTGDEVAHIDNISKKISVEAIVFEKEKLSHIRCWWWSDDKIERINVHSNKIIPWVIAKQGQDHVDSYLEEITKRM